MKFTVDGDILVRMIGAKMVVEALMQEGIEVVFGYPGGAIMNIYDEIYKQKYFRHILVRHEQGAVHCADGYARATGKVGVAMVTSGPGITNAITGLATSYMDSTPLVLISAQVPLGLIGTDAFQEVDAVGISRPCTKHNYLVKDVVDLPYILKEAFYIAKSGRKGPVHIDIPKDITVALGEFEYPKTISIQNYNPTYKGHKKQIKKAVEAIMASQRPLLYIGGGAISSDAYRAIRSFVQMTKIPAVETLMARGILKYDDPNLLGMVGMHGSYVSNMAMSEADLLISLGVRFDDRVTGKISEFAKHAKIIHVDIDPSSIGKLVNIDFPIVGDIVSVMIEINKAISQKLDPLNFKSWVDLLEKYKSLHPLKYKDTDEPIKPQWVIEEVARQLGDKAIVVTDVGQHQMWAAQFYPFEFPRQFITSGGLGTMGFGLPAAIGAKSGRRDKTVINITGDGSILMNMQEIITSCESNIPCINIILNNGYLGMVRQWQHFFYDKRYSFVNLKFQPDFVKLVESCGGVGFICKEKSTFKNALSEAIDCNKTTFIDVRVDKNENVLPMVPSGNSIYNMMLNYEE